MNAYEVMFRSKGVKYRAITVSPSCWAARVHATAGKRNATVSSVRQIYGPNGAPRIFCEQTTQEKSE